MRNWAGQVESPHPGLRLCMTVLVHRLNTSCIHNTILRIMYIMLNDVSTTGAKTKKPNPPPDAQSPQYNRFPAFVSICNQSDYIETVDRDLLTRRTSTPRA
jgi:hypothetical protein